MDVSVKFLGAAGTVTGSRYLLDLGDFEFLVDCGLFQGRKELRRRNWDKFPMPPTDMEAIVLTHAHMDHIGCLPKLVKDGFSGPIYCTAVTAELAKILLLDSGKLQEEEAEYARKKGYSRHENPEPLYTVEDAEAVFPLFVPQEFKKPFSIHPSVEVTYYYAGHILGAAITKIVIKGDKQTKKLVFSGDLGRYHDPLLFPPTLIPGADVVWIESTYGDRISTPVKPEEELARAINDVFSRDGLVIIPAFAVGRTQLVMYYLYQLMKKGKIPNVPIYLDSPMAINVSKLYQEFHQDHQLIAVLDNTDQHPFQHSQLHYYRKQEQSRTLNDLKGKAIIISASGMATGGRVLHHLFHHLPDERNGVVFVGYQAEGTRGRRLVNGDTEVRIYGQEVPVKAKIYSVEGLSAHADQNELMEWAEGFSDKPKLAFIIHGEEKSASVLAQKLKDELGWNTVIPNYLESFMLFEGI
ncbi:MBL fold metallo-hydrolase RNA specificity domain-containing protein [Algoriphagus aquimarinus]|uniref:Metallo-beta-lactamase family protein n=1 Tax=Algoriphagus aquimarinus TaxID=237018 RepID=A0A1I1BWA1_9BACT|nr:MBL fold metallo-hydrolase [Algoriphagus aquimarinus]SFB54407.1 metallo-beta-lactamase family protein [Algoriphagus aquimarinus]|tara:strand:+ start:153776 stop:155176 length:1401 start_codon:yes stop_codon:yes gene_type:complete